jgi:hypothetical protein
MNSNNVEKSWQNILCATRTIEQASAEEHWAQVAELAANRHRMITEHFGRYPVGPNTAEFYQQHLSQFLMKEERLQQLASEARKASMKAGIKLNSNKKALNAYKQA